MILKEIKSERIVAVLYLLLSIALNVNAQQASRRHTVQRGETVYRIGLNYGVTIDEIYRLNPSAKNGIKEGQVLVIPSRVVEQVDQKSETTYHKVERGETLYSISRRYGVDVNAILSANTFIKSPEQLSQGTLITIPASTTANNVIREEGTKPSTSDKGRPVTGLRTYTVPAGATIYSLLQVTGWGKSELFHYNPQLRIGLKAGATILIPDATLTNNEAMGSRPAFPVGQGVTVALALPFSNDKGERFSMYYEGFLMALLEAKNSGLNVHLYTVDCNDQYIEASTSLLNSIPAIDLILGGVSEASIERLGKIAKSKGATYVIPFTSKNYANLAKGSTNIYQVNPPHKALFSEVAKKFVKEFGDRYIQIVTTAEGGSDKAEFVSVLKGQLSSKGIPFEETDLTSFSDIHQLQRVSAKKHQVVVVPDAGSLSVAKSILETIEVAKDSLAIDNVRAFGYPEWQTYQHSIGNKLRANNAIFYTTFYADPGSKGYQLFEREFKRWYQHGIGSTFPRYSLLGYDTGRYFLELIASEESGGRTWRGIQSKFEFIQDPKRKSLRSNLGIFFVQFQERGEAIRF